MLHNDNLNFSMNQVRTLISSEICNSNTCFKKTMMFKRSTPSSPKTIFSSRKHFPPLNLEEPKLPFLLPTFYHIGFRHVSNAFNYEKVPPLENYFLPLSGSEISYFGDNNLSLSQLTTGGNNNKNLSERFRDSKKMRMF